MLSVITERYAARVHLLRAVILRYILYSLRESFLLFLADSDVLQLLNASYKASIALR